MLIWKRTFIVIVVLANVLLFVVLGGIMIVLALLDTMAEPRDRLPISLMFIGIIGLVNLGIGIGSLVCMRLAYCSQGRKQLAAIIVGLVLCAAVATVGIMTASGESGVLSFILYSSVSIATACSLLFVRPRQIESWQCQHCEYDLRGLEDRAEGGGNGVCPECGNETSAEAGSARA